MPRDRVLIAAARRAAELAYAPYSRFRVGAAVSAAGAVYTGCNIENASYGLAICAERVAIFSAVAAGVRRIEAIALACLDADGDAAIGALMPCGACRQVMAEFSGPDLPVHVSGAGDLRLGRVAAQPLRLCATPTADKKPVN